MRCRILRSSHAVASSLPPKTVVAADTVERRLSSSDAGVAMLASIVTKVQKCELLPDGFRLGVEELDVEGAVGER